MFRGKNTVFVGFLSTYFLLYSQIEVRHGFNFSTSFSREKYKKSLPFFNSFSLQFNAAQPAALGAAARIIGIQIKIMFIY
jgi:hypothetical protein